MRTEEIVEILQGEGRYRIAQKPLHVAESDLTFDFDAVLTGPDDQGGLVLVTNAREAPISMIHLKLKSFSRVLDRTESMRPLSLVLITEDPNNPVIHDMENLCRVTMVTPDRDPKECLHKLLPLELPNPEKAIESADEALSLELESADDSVFIGQLLKAAHRSSHEVQRVILEEIGRTAKASHARIEESS